MPKSSRMSVRISATTNLRVERHARRTGVRKGQIVEQALLHYLRGLDTLPAEYVVQPRMVVSREAGARMLRVTKSVKPTPALRRLMRDTR